MKWTAPKTKSSKLQYENWQKQFFGQFFFQNFFLSQAISHIKTMLLIPTFTPHDFFCGFYGPKYFQRHNSMKWTAPFNVKNKYSCTNYRTSYMDRILSNGFISISNWHSLWLWSFAQSKWLAAISMDSLWTRTS